MKKEDKEMLQTFAWVMALVCGFSLFSVFAILLGLYLKNIWGL